MPGPLRLSVIDLGWPVEIVELVPALEEFGYQRFWVTEHHSPRQSASPAVLLGMAGALSHRLRIGSAGVLLNFATPLRVAEDFFLLENFYPGRVDLGLAKGVAQRGDPVSEALVDGRPWPDEGTFARKLEEVCSLIRRQPSPSGAAAPAIVGPWTDRQPQLWTCGLGRGTAMLAGRLGTNLAFSDYFLGNGNPAPRPGDGPAVVDAYLQSYQPAMAAAAPHVAISCYGMCCESLELARRAWEECVGGTTAKPSFLGTPEQCFDQLNAIADRYRASELVVQSLAREVTARVRSYGLIAERFRLTPSGGEPSGEPDQAMADALRSSV
jgi:luciferase family oxidoreductase group 1